MPSKSQTTNGIAATALACLIMMAGCRAEQPSDAVDENLVLNEKPAAPLPVIEAPYTRARMLLTVARAASAHAAGQDDASFQRLLDGKQFEARLRFGCNGQGSLEEDSWSLDPDGKTMRIRAVPTLSLNDQVVRNVATEKVEAVEGFWMNRPWLLQAACPAVRSNISPREQAGSSEDSGTEAPQLVRAANQRIGIAQFFGAEDSRTRQRLGKAFETVIQLDEAQKIGSHGFDLVISGRLRARNDGRVILCSGDEADRPPDCVISAAIDQVRIENPDNKAVLAEWSV